MPSLPLHTEPVRTSQRNQMIDVTDRVEAIARKARVIDGMAIVFVPHTTAAVTINENADPDQWDSSPVTFFCSDFFLKLLSGNFGGGTGLTGSSSIFF